MKRLILGIMLSGSAGAQTQGDLLVPRLMLYQLDASGPTLRAIGNLPATVTQAPIIIFGDDGSFTTSTMEVDDAAYDEKSSPASP